MGVEVFSVWSAAAVLEKAEVVEEERSGNHLFIIISSDRGLCGSVHSNLARTIRPIMEQRSSSASTYFVCVGDKVCTAPPHAGPSSLHPPPRFAPSYSEH